MPRESAVMCSLSSPAVPREFQRLDQECLKWECLPDDQPAKAVGMMRLAMARDSKLAAVCATVILKNCSVRLIPPKKKHIPKTRSRLDSILPIKDVCTIITSS